jgi:glutamate 5-kinase
MSEERQQFLGAVRSVVIKLGTQLLAAPAGAADDGATDASAAHSRAATAGAAANPPAAKSPASASHLANPHAPRPGAASSASSAPALDAQYLANVAGQIVALRARGLALTLVSSGAISAGVRELGLPCRPRDLARLQAVAAVGQRRLMEAWAAAFSPHGLSVAQLLLTREDIDDRSRFLNVRNTISAVHALGAIPIINENDTISTDEIAQITFGDNDILAAVVAHALSANLLVLMSVVDGLLDAGGRPVRLVRSIDEARQLVRAEKSALGKGGMNSKLEAARMVSDAGEAMVVVDGRMNNVLIRLIEGEPVGTLFAPHSRKRSSRGRWIGSVRPVGTIAIDAGAVRALVEGGRSLLPAGVTQVEGSFARGDCIAIHDPAGRMIGRGLSNYSADETRAVLGRKTAQVRALLGTAAYDEVVHRDNLIVNRPAANAPEPA